jgi:hypothetical protein
MHISYTCQTDEHEIKGESGAWTTTSNLSYEKGNPIEADSFAYDTCLESRLRDPFGIAQGVTLRNVAKWPFHQPSL